MDSCLSSQRVNNTLLNYYDKIIYAIICYYAANDANSTKLMLKLANGKKVVRLFYKSDFVRCIYAFAISEDSEANGGREFELFTGNLIV